MIVGGRVSRVIVGVRVSVQLCMRVSVRLWAQGYQYDCGCDGCSVIVGVRVSV